MQSSFVFKLYLLIYIYFLLCLCDCQNEDDTHGVNVDEHRYSHHAILGQVQSEIFNKFTPEESKEKFSEIIDKMDSNHDGQIDVPELKSWIKHNYQRILDEDVETQWNAVAKDNVDKIDFQSFIDNAFKDGVGERKEHIIQIEKRRWEAADLDKDNLLNKSELLRFIHPEEFDDMKPLLAQESLDELDKDKNGFVDIDEYMKDIFPQGQEIKDEWIRHERQNFGVDRDMNKDGYLDREEIQNWLMPAGYDRIEAQAEHIMHKAGAGDGGVLTKAEMLDKYYIFVGSRNHDNQEYYIPHEDL